MNHSRFSSRTGLVTRTLWRIETALARAPSLDDLARAEGISPFHLSRAFTLVTGQSVMAYVRARRLSEAARQLHGGDDSVLSVALDAGYESPEGFARAFRALFGMAPRMVRATLPTNLTEPLIMHPTDITLPAPRIVDFPGLRVIGRSWPVTMSERQKVPGFWDSTIQEIGQPMFNRETFGICHDFDDERFRYMVAFEDDGDHDGLDRMTLPAGRYAVFEHAGHVSSISDTWNAIFEKWVPGSGQELGEGPEFERYAKDFDPEGEGRVSIWIPLKA